MASPIYTELFAAFLDEHPELAELSDELLGDEELLDEIIAAGWTRGCDGG
jgi:hypothetical protein